MQWSASAPGYVQGDHVLWGAVEKDSSQSTPNSSSSSTRQRPVNLEGVACLDPSGSSGSDGPGNPKAKAGAGSSSSSKAPLAQTVTLKLKALPCDELIPKLPVDANGEPTSIGSREHAKRSCRPCPKLLQGESCPRGIYCDFCHFPHEQYKKGLKPCKGQRRRYRKCLEDLKKKVASSDGADFDLNSVELPASLNKHPERKVRLQNKLDDHVVKMNAMKAIDEYRSSSSAQQGATDFFQSSRFSV